MPSDHPILWHGPHACEWPDQLYYGSAGYCDFAVFVINVKLSLNSYFRVFTLRHY